MRPSQPFRLGTVGGVAASLLALSVGQTAAAPPAALITSTSASPSAVTVAQGQAARAVARSLGDGTWRARLQHAALASDEVAVTALARHDGRSRLTTMLAAADRRIAAAKGLDAADVGPLLRLRLGDKTMRGALRAGTTPWVVPATAADDATTAVAYDSRGRAHTIDARDTPSHPVYVIDIDSSKALDAGLGVLNDQFHRYGLASAAPAAQQPPGAEALSGAGGFWSTRISAVKLSDDKEPWVKGDAEIYTLVTGFGQDGKVRVDPVDMPYLDNEKTVYRPNQILVNWSYYKYNLADAVMMEEDGSTNYRDLAKAIATVLLTVTDQGTYIPLVNALLEAIPDNWWTDDPDYVDSWYTLAQSDKGTRYGARGNGWMTVEPYFVKQF
ncbi:DUF3103 family protein [Streptomyces sp. NPDC048419]|uniref:DUF3103 family protein n=1 Tax=Streptomyces sp. NPDC048419 TaxID=3365547 RepID=UPI00371ADCD0